MKRVDSSRRDAPAEPSTTSPPEAHEEAPAGPIEKRSPAGRAGAILGWTGRFLVALFLFVGALQIMKTGAAGLDILQHGGLLVKNAASTLGLGWIGALLVLSGSPIAASALTLVAAGSISETEGFSMLTGSRLGAAFVVLLVAVIYAARGGSGERKKPISTAVLALSTTALIYVPGFVIGLFLLRSEPFQQINIQFPTQFSDLIDVVYGPILDRIETWPSLVLFIGGLAVLLVSFKLIDKVVPEMSDEKIEQSRLSWLRRKWPMFGLGCLVALVTMSVSVALTVLVPLVSKKYVKREHIIPYIMGANITTLGDTLLAAFLLHDPATVRIVIASIAGSTIVTLVVLAFFYPQVRSGIWRFHRVMIKSRTRLAFFTAALFLVPVATIGIAGLVA
jgi:solute carrier family 34 (sodium-dependent phosphate cotransporter)